MSKHHNRQPHGERGFTDREHSRNTAAEQRARQAMRDTAWGGRAKNHGKTQKATLKHRGR
ncbi:hypothetical protein JJV70_17200 [Streptomyces sp. JJ66]|uniref:hypothetical protein n=1 Tax=Streptomyces sp. JJ66 TaxID=2803843 RepID=UPI001C586DC2|nr:hypothetical protein [Streptomyces sp. JJ66]MBW1603813.1 hypothetical protein [Streptomyces sp. JJ66]